ncbi:MAG TPA: FAD-dependent monooxygenase [Microbacterium sp.]|uniref:FAD-dependent monooxygenase n=1 Tax=Microbacterium sp. TaxID=51671 RepID=UPI002B476FB9|nr:FAD-dependent monooxygenase [Microbacterium sp.]HKT55978.1 FAD-dependent monooxygenase [Microbacterium sp.]
MRQPELTADGVSGHEWDVVVAGAGPVGLLLAGELAGAGIRTLVLEAAEEPSTIPKANGIVGRSARDLAKRGILAGSGMRVLSPRRFQFGPLALDLGTGPGNPLHILPIPQRRLEQLLEDRAIASGATLRRGHAVTGFTQDASQVQIEVRAAQGAAHVTTAFLVGCDGARSLVRKHAGIGFPGFTSEEIARIARVTIPGEAIARVDGGFDIRGVGRVAGMRPNRLPGGGFSIAPVSVLDPSAPADLYVISTHEPRGDAEPSDRMLVDELRASARRVLGADLPFTAADAIRSTVGNSRHADAYRVGRVLLAGDAAHIFNAGGSGLNAGIQDAFDLAARLVATIRDGATADTLDGYEANRRPAVERVLDHTRVQAALTRDDDVGRALRAVMGELLADRAAARTAARLLESA